VWVAAGVTWAPIMPRKVLGHSTIAGKLMDLGVDPTALDDRLCSALHYAAGLSPMFVLLVVQPQVCHQSTWCCSSLPGVQTIVACRTLLTLGQI